MASFAFQDIPTHDRFIKKVFQEDTNHPKICKSWLLGQEHLLNLLFLLGAVAVPCPDLEVVVGWGAWAGGAKAVVGWKVIDC